MKRWVASLALLCLAPAARAGGLNLSWERCFGDVPQSNRSFSCGTTAGTETLVASFVPSVPSNGVTSVSTTIDFHVATGVLPAWLVGSTCGLATLSSSGFDAAHDIACRDWTGVGGSGVGITSYTYPFPTGVGSSARLKLACSVSPGVSILGNVEYVAARVLISHAALVSPSGCGGCADPVTIANSTVNVSSSLVGQSQVIVQPVSGPSNQATWQGTGPVLVHRGTFAAIKSLYR
jgi:hypothetical protein